MAIFRGGSGDLDPGWDEAAQLPMRRTAQVDPHGLTPEWLQEKEAIAAAATPGPWTAETHVTGYLSGDAPGVAVRWWNGPSASPVCMVQPHMSGRYMTAGSQRPVEDARHIATFDPLMVRKLLAVARYAQAVLNDDTTYDHDMLRAALDALAEPPPRAF